MKASQSAVIWIAAVATTVLTWRLGIAPWVLLLPLACLGAYRIGKQSALNPQGVVVGSVRVRGPIKPVLGTLLLFALALIIVGLQR